MEGYKHLTTYVLATVIHDLTVQFCKHFLNRTYRTVDQMEQAARSGKQNIAEGYYAIWPKDDVRVRKFRAFRAIWVKPNIPNTPNLPNDPEEAANMLLTFCQMESFLLARQVNALKEKFIKEGGFRESLFKKRMEFKRDNK